MRDSILSLNSSGGIWKLFERWRRSEHVSGAWAAKKPLRAPTYFCNDRSPLYSRSAPRPPAPRFASAPLFSATPAPRSAPLHPIFGPLRSVFRSAYAPLKCSGAVVAFPWFWRDLQNHDLSSSLHEHCERDCSITSEQCFCTMFTVPVVILLFLSSIAYRLLDYAYLHCRHLKLEKFCVNFRRTSIIITVISCGRHLSCCVWQLDPSTELRRLTSTASLSSCRRSSTEPCRTLLTSTFHKVFSYLCLSKPSH